MTHGFRGVELGLGWIFLGLAVGIGHRNIGPKIVWIPLVILLLSVLAAIPGSMLLGRGLTGITVYNVVWILPFGLLYLVCNKESILEWIIPLLGLHTMVLIFEGITERSKQSGLLDNANPAGSLLVIGSVYLLTTKYRWLAPFTMVGLFFTGSRAAVLGLGIVITIMGVIWLYKRYKVYWKPVILGGVLIVVLLGFNLGGVEGNLPRGANLWSMSVITTGITDYQKRIKLTDTPSFIPKGITTSWGLHSLPERISVEFGILAGIAWVFLTIYALTRRPLFNGSWWILFTIVVLAFSEYSMWLGPLAALWWMTLGIRVKGKIHEST